MQPIPRPFFLCFETVLQNRLSREDLMQVMDESMWEYVSLHQGDPSGKAGNPGAAVRIGAICLSFYRLMAKAGYLPEEAHAAIAHACGIFAGRFDQVANGETCSIAGYFQAKNATALCDAAFCGRCSRNETGSGAGDLLRMGFSAQPETR
ncbi:MAG: hypothetical protein JWP91_3967 [Fibrobacteres bacterium]|nr:hypothetical protein [Fibrobacterota bacterium]